MIQGIKNLLAITKDCLATIFDDNISDVMQ